MCQRILNYLLHVVVVVPLRGSEVLRLAGLEIVLLFLSRQELEHPIVLDFNVRWQLFLKENQRMHLPEKLVATWILTLLPEVLAFDLEILRWLILAAWLR